MPYGYTGQKTDYSIKEFPKEHRIGEVKCVDCEYYESIDWKPEWCERYCHHPEIFRTGLTDGSWGCEKWRKKSC